MTISSDTISIRLATPDDAGALARLAALDSAQTPTGPVLLAERDGELQVALPLSAPRVPLADPFAATAELVELLRLRANALHRIQPPWRRHLPRSILRLSFAGRTASD
jgi:hypothetical protein